MDIQFCAVSWCGRSARWVLAEAGNEERESYLCDRCHKALAGKDPDGIPLYTAIVSPAPLVRQPGRGAMSQSHRKRISSPGFSTVFIPGSPAEKREKERIAAFLRDKEAREAARNSGA
ncbi:MAG TPA: hypothetical protein VGS41_17625 [Chthonomonadales bacterium]|nr:hypothetical protein [Chthonomonadales bacterium]